MRLSSSDILQVVTTGNTSGSLDYKIRYEDYNATTGIVAFGTTEGNINSNTTTTLVTSPSSGNYRNITYLSLFNNNNMTVTAKVQSYNGSTAYTMFQSDDLQQFYTIGWTVESNWKLFNDTGAVLTGSSAGGTVTSVGLS